jgi:hypothetical protein
LLLIGNDAQLIASHRFVNQLEVIQPIARPGFPEFTLIPGYRTLTATGESYWPLTQIGAGTSSACQMTQRNIPVLVGEATIIEFYEKENNAMYFQVGGDFKIGCLYFTGRESGHPDDTIEHRFKLGITHFFGDAFATKEKDRLDQFFAVAICHT